MQALTRRQRRRHAWLALAVVMWLTLAPSLSHAMQLLQGRYAPWQELCSVLYGAAPADQDSGNAAHVVQSVFHCAYCAMDASGVGLPPVLPVVGAEPAECRETLPRLSLVGPRTLFAWSAAQPRAPPPKTSV